ncbi:MAG TPA: hypothetical protein VIC55_06690 [Gemmatimonadaceae bacterium]
MPMVLLNIWNPPQRVLADSFGMSESDHGPSYEQLASLATRRAAELLAEGETALGGVYSRSGFASALGGQVFSGSSAWSA